MRFQRSRAAVLSAAAIVFVLAACAPPGQEGDPGVAATYEGSDVTNADVNVTYQAWLNDTKGKDAANRRQIITIQLLQNDLLARCKELGYPVTWATAEGAANSWITFKGETGEASDAMITATQGILALYIVASVDPTLGDLAEISDKVAKTVEVSPRSGVYSTEALLASVKTAMKTAEDQQLGNQFSFTEFQNVTALVDADLPWFDRVGIASTS